MTKSKRTTVLIVNDHVTKSLSVNPKVLVAIKPAFISLGVIVLVLLALLSYVATAYMRSDKQVAELQAQSQSMQAEIVDLQNFTSAEIGRKLSLLKESEKTVSALQKYLQNRGVSVEPIKLTEPKQQIETENDAVGGPEILAAAPLPAVGVYGEQTRDLLAIAEKVPLGKPSTGRITSRFGYRHNPFSGRGREFHGGLDFRGKTGEPVKSTASGKVIFSGYQNGYGNVVKVAHGYGYVTVYAHLSARDVTLGDKVSVGDLIGKIGSTGRSTGPHLHYEVQYQGQRIDPENFLALN